ncbi:hypothetical protein MMC22_003208 [Lobaria immixta]|nr:hypothetical protein [Lobaria immixta]
MMNISSSGRTIIHLCIFLAVIDTVAVLLRLLAKKSIKAAFAADDAWVVASVCCFYVFVGVIIWGAINSGATLDRDFLGHSNHVILRKANYIAVVFFTCTITAFKISILCLYSNIFTTRPFRLTALAVGLVTILRCIVVVFLNIFQCDPIHAYWDTSLLSNPSSHCLDFNKLFVGYAVTDVLLDVIILYLPVYMIRTLHLPKRQKLILCAIFLLGSFVCVAGILRVALIYNGDGISAPISQYRIVVWSTVELGVGILCACLPTYRPLLRQISALYSSARDYHGHRKSQRTKSSSLPKDSGIESGSGYNHLDDKPVDKTCSSNAVGGLEAERQEGAFRHYQLNKIYVESRIDVV